MVGPLRLQARARGHGADHVAARGAELGLGEAVLGVSPGRPRCDRVVVGAGGGSDVDRADGDHERVVAGRVEDAARCAGGAVVAGSRDHDDPVEPELLDGLVERIEVEVRLGRRVQREVRDLDVVGVLVGEDPLRRRDHVRGPCDAVVVHHPHRQNVRRGRGAGVAGVAARRDPRDEGAVAVPVTLRVGRGRAKG